MPAKVVKVARDREGDEDGSLFVGEIRRRRTRDPVHDAVCDLGDRWRGKVEHVRSRVGENLAGKPTKVPVDDGHNVALLAPHVELHAEKGRVDLAKLLLVDKEVVAATPKMPSLVHLADGLLVGIEDVCVAVDEKVGTGDVQQRVAVRVQDGRFKRTVQAQELPAQGPADGRLFRDERNVLKGLI